MSANLLSSDTGTALCSSFNTLSTLRSSSAGADRPGQPYHSKFVPWLRPLMPVTRPPEDLLYWYRPPAWRFIVIGRRLEATMSFLSEPSCSWFRLGCGLEGWVIILSTYVAVWLNKVGGRVILLENDGWFCNKVISDKCTEENRMCAGKVLRNFPEALFWWIGHQKPRESKDVCYLVVILWLASQAFILSTGNKARYVIYPLSGFQGIE